jgi:8-oxo-dGTP pyrophosphatase MutT (NUDIX family)
MSSRIVKHTNPVTIEIDRAPAIHAPNEAVDHAWDGLCAQNPRYFNGPILAFDSFNDLSGVIRAHVDSYKQHAVRASVDLGVKILSVTGIFAANRDNESVYLLGKRAESTHWYGGKWEFGPSGGIEVPSDEQSTIDTIGIIRELQREAIEEAGLELTGCEASVLGIAHDDSVGSVDIVIGVEVPEAFTHNPNWEYTQIRWMTRDEILGWIERDPDAFIDPTIELARGVLPFGA